MISSIGKSNFIAKQGAVGIILGLRLKGLSDAYVKA